MQKMCNCVKNEALWAPFESLRKVNLTSICNLVYILVFGTTRFCLVNTEISLFFTVSH